MPGVKNQSRRERFQHWFRMFDANRDGYIDKDDYVVMAERIAHATRTGDSTRAKGLIEPARARFAQLEKADTDGDGLLNLQDYVLTHVAFGLNPPLQGSSIASATSTSTATA